MKWMNSISTVSFMLSILTCAVIGRGEEVCKFENQGLPEKLNGDTVIVHEKNVAMSEFVKVGDPSDIVTVGNPCSIMFLVDVSSSNTASKTDLNGVRFDVIVDVLDSIYKKNSQVMVGLELFASGLWFYAPDDPLFESMTGSSSNAYIPLLQLDKEYSGVYTLADNWGDIESQEPYTMKGIDVLKMYLEIVDNWHTVVGGKIAKYNPSKKVGGLTNITMAFEASKEAHNNSPHTPDKHFNIFFSDGYATQGGDAYIDGIDVPTTFTIYYNPMNPSDLDVLKLMTNNIKNNGYSVSNNMTNIWDMAMDHNSLVNLLIDNVISKIITNVVTFETTDITVNGLGEISGSDENGFYFKNLFPLVGEYTDFGYEITYHCRKDSITDKGDTIHVKSWDTTHTVDYTVKIEEGAPEPDSVTFTYWGRNLEFYNNGNKVDLIDESMKEIEIRFTEYSVDTLYDYKRADVEVTNVTGSVDREELELEKKGSYFSYLLPLSQGTGSSNDGTLQHKNPDTLIATFRNPKLPLDTLQVKIPYFEEWSYTLTGATYFDNSADGHVDSIFIDVDGLKVVEHVDSIMKFVELPAFREFEVNSYKAYENGIALDVTEKMEPINTAVTSADKIIIATTTELDGDIIINKSSVDVVDKVAPVILSASLRDSADVTSRDELTVNFSETVTEDSESEPFLYYSVGENKNFTAALSLLEHKGTSAVYEVKTLSGVSSIMQGDSIWIDASLSVPTTDLKSNAQDNSANIHREIDVIIIDKGMHIRDASYYDDNADGHVDRVALTIEGGELKESDANTLSGKLQLPAFRNFTLDKVNITGSGIDLIVAEGGDIITATMTEDVLQLEDTLFLDADDAYIVPVSLDIIDKIAPVIMSASLRDSAEVTSRDELTVTFSEIVQEDSESEPFLYYSVSEDKNFTATLSRLEHSGTSAVYEVKTLSGVSSIVQGDSIWIDASLSAPTTDLKSNAQDNSANIHREIDVMIIDKGMHVRDASYYDDNADGHVDRVALTIEGGELKQSDANTLSEKLLLPAFRDLTVDKVNITGAGIDLFVTEAGDITTATTSDDIIELADTLFLEGDDAYIVPITLDIQDRMAPVIMTAAFIDSAKTDARDELTLTFSESIADIPEIDPFEFYATGSENTYTADLVVLEKTGNTLLCEVLSLTNSDVIQQGDSIRINSTIDAPLSDPVQNSQDNAENIRREIAVTVIEEGLYLASAAYFDNNADGHIDSLYVNLYGKDDEIENYTDTLVALMRFPEFRNFSIEDYHYESGGIAFTLQEEREEIQTAVTTEDILSIEDTVVLSSDSMLILPSMILIADSVAPIIMSATYVDSMVVFIKGGEDSLTTLGQDSLFITFSEEFDSIGERHPFVFTTNSGNDYYEVDLSEGVKDGLSMSFSVNELINIEQVSDGDSVQINAEEPTIDVMFNKQDNENNIFRPLYVEEVRRDSLIPLPFDFVVKSTILDKDDETAVSDQLLELPEIQDMLDEAQESENGEYTGIMVITVTPDPVENVTIYDEYEVNNVTIFDKVGNIITSGKKMVYIEETKQLLMIWDGRNSLGRFVGSGSYLAFVPIEYTFNNQRKPTILKEEMLGIKD